MSDLASPPSPQTPPSPRRWTRALLFVSLALNLAVIGVVAGLALKGPPAPPGPAGMDLGLRGYAEALPEPFRRDLGRSLRESRGDWAGPRERARQMRANLAAALTAEPYDPAAVARVLDEGNLLLAELGRRGSGLVAAQIARMDAAERAAYAHRLLDPPHGRRPGGEGRPGPRDAPPGR